MIGNGLPVYRGYASQYGHGLGNVLGGIIRSAIPFMAPVVKSAGRSLLLAGAKKIQKKFKKKKKKPVKRTHAMPPGKRSKVKIVSKKPRDIFA